jgi:hypothetical protein
MLLYPGGTELRPDTKGYLFAENWVSDLGATANFVGISNLASLIVFIIAFSIMTISIIPFVLSFPIIPQPTRIQKLFYWPARIAGVFVAISFFCIGITPIDVNYDLHMIFVQCAFLGALLMLFCNSITLLIQTAYPKRYAAVTIITLIYCFIYAYLFITSDFRATLQIYQSFALGQKIAIYSIVACLMYQAWGTVQQLKLLRSPP